MNTDDALHEEANFKAEAIGPYGSSLLVGTDQPKPTLFFQVDWSEDLKRLAAAPKTQDVDMEYRWAVFAGSGEMKIVLEIDWSEPPARAVLFFDMRHWHTELGLVDDAAGMMVLVDRTAEGWDKYTGITVLAPSEMLNAAVRVWARVHH